MTSARLKQAQQAHLHGTRAVLALTLLLASVVACADNKPSIPADWKTECIGKYQISVPGDVVVAVTSQKARNASSSGVAFSDDNNDGLGISSFAVEGNIEVSPVLSNESLQKHWDKYTNITNPALGLKISKDRDSKGFKYDWDQGASVSLYRADRIYKFRTTIDTHSKEVLADAKTLRDKFITNFATRQLFEIPPSAGVCFPYGFLKTTPNTDFIEIGVGMRLLDHPDVEIFFKHSTVGEIPHSPDSEDRVKWFWSTYGPTKGNKLDGVVDHYHHIDLAGYSAVYATADIARPNDSLPNTGQPMESYEKFNKRMKKEMAQGKYPLDYGFMAYYHKSHDPAIKEEPYLTLYVIRTASRAIAAGKKPVTRDELYTMAKQIAASIKLKPVQ